MTLSQGFMRGPLRLTLEQGISQLFKSAGLFYLPYKKVRGCMRDYLKMGFNLLEKLFYIYRYTFIYHRHKMVLIVSQHTSVIQYLKYRVMLLAQKILEFLNIILFYSKMKWKLCDFFIQVQIIYINSLEANKWATDLFLTLISSHTSRSEKPHSEMQHCFYSN